jgi:hypothetical protein
VQDSVRYLGGIDLLVGLLATPCARVADAAKCALYGLRHENAVNQDDIYHQLRRWAAAGRPGGRAGGDGSAAQLYLMSEWHTSQAEVDAIWPEMKPCANQDAWPPIAKAPPAACTHKRPALRVDRG